MDGEERRLVQRCLAGDEAACAELVRIHSRVIGTIIWRDRQQPVHDPEALLSKAEAEHLIRTHVNELPDKYRLPLMYATVEGLDYATIGAMLNGRSVP